jgi:hypothetical protein
MTSPACRRAKAFDVRFDRTPMPLFWIVHGVDSARHVERASITVRTGSTPPARGACCDGFANL